MVKYIVKRIGIGLLTLFVLVTVTFFLTRMMPGSPFDIANLTPANQEKMISFYGLDRPLTEQYVQYLGNLFHGDFGVSFKKAGVTVNDLIASLAPATMKLGAISYGVSLILGTALGIWMAVTRQDLVKGSILTFSTFGVSVPNFVLALLLMLVFGSINPSFTSG